MKICSECNRCFDDAVEECSEWHGSLSTSRPGRVSMVAGYTIETRLYTGLRGDLFRATRTDCGRSCLIRVSSADTEIAQLFVNEARIVTNLFHPNLTAVYESGTTDDGEVYLVSEDPCEEYTLRERLERRGKPDLLESIRIVRTVAETLHELHKSGLVFRALSPENVLISAESEMGVRLQNIDLGGAAQHGIISNKFLIDTETPAIRYFSPEQCSGEPATPRSDIYSLGILLYELIAGVPPFDADRAAGVIEQHRQMRPPDVKIDNFDLRMLISHTLMESLSKRPELRPSSADLFARQLRHIEQLATHVSTPAPVVKNVASPPKPTPRIITTAESGLDRTETAEAYLGGPSAPRMVTEPSIVEIPSNKHPAKTPARRRVTIQPEAAEPSLPAGKIDPESIKQINFRAARERMKELLAATPAPPPPKLIRLDEPLDDVPSIDDTLEVLRSEGDLSPEFHVASHDPAEISTEMSTAPGDEEPVVPPIRSAASTRFIGQDHDISTPPTDEHTFRSSSAMDEALFASVESFSAVRFARLRRGIAIGAAVGLIALAFTFRADIVETFTPFDLGKLEPPPYRPAAASVTVPTRQTSETIAAPVTQYEINKSDPVVAEDLPTAVRVSGAVNDREDRSQVRKAAVKPPVDRAAEPVKAKRQPEQYRPETLVITYPDPKARKAGTDRDPFVKPKSGAGMTRPRIVANPKP